MARIYDRFFDCIEHRWQKVTPEEIAAADTFACLIRKDGIRVGTAKWEFGR